MPYIIAATDFSEVSDNAVHYAANLAVLQNTDLVILHSFAFPVMVSDVPLPASLIDETQHDAEKHIRNLEKKLAEIYPDVNIKSIVTYGTLVDSVQQHAAKYGAPWLTVMGNSITSEKSSWFFSTLKDAAKQLKYSILAVPENAHYKPIRKICFGIDIDHPDNTTVLEKVANYATTLKTELHVFNAQEDAFDPELIPQVSDEAKATLYLADPLYHFRYEVNTDDAIREFCSSISADWLAIQPRKYPIIESIFHRSHTKALASSIDIPMLILH